MMKTAIVLLLSYLVVNTAAANDAAPAIWDELRIGMGIDEATELLRPGHAHATLTQSDNSGYRKFWPVNAEQLVVANDIARALFPHGHVIVLYHDSGRMITEIKREFVTEDAYQESLKAIKQKQGKQPGAAEEPAGAAAR